MLFLYNSFKRPNEQFIKLKHSNAFVNIFIEIAIENVGLRSCFPVFEYVAADQRKPHGFAPTKKSGEVAIPSSDNMQCYYRKRIDKARSMPHILHMDIAARISSYDYELPPELIAQEPAEPRDSSRLLVMSRASGALTDNVFSEMPGFLREGDLLLANNTRVFPARLLGKKTSGGKAEVFLLEHLSSGEWLALVRPGRRLRDGTIIEISSDLDVEITGRLPDGRRRVRFHTDNDIWKALELHGHTPLPFYIDREDRPEDADRYQTVFAKKRGAVAAPTAGLHFTDGLIEELHNKAVEFANITLHVGWGTFHGIEVDDIREHEMHSEYYEIDEPTASAINRAKSEGRRIICVGTTTVRAVESAATRGTLIEPHSARTELFIMPGFEFKVTDAMITNFHLPRSSLLVMVSAFAGRDSILRAYCHAVEKRYRFYSYGDAMLIL